MLPAILAVSCLWGCSAREAKTSQLVIFAASSLTDTVTQIGEQFMEENPDTEILFHFDSSGTLLKQMKEGAECDIFISAGQKQMDELTADPDGEKLVLENSRRDLVENKVVLAVPDGNPAGIDSYEDLIQRLTDADVMLAMGNADVPVGQYAQRILAYYGLEEEALVKQGCITYGSNTREVTVQIKEAAVDCGIIYATDAAWAGLTVVDMADDSISGQVVYPAAILKKTADRRNAEAFMEYLTQDSADQIFEKAGFCPVEQKG